jgi:ferredoxin--NADP+ reductase
LVHAVRYAAELSYREVIESIRIVHGGRLQYIPFVSRERLDYALHGRIPAAIGDGSLEARAGVALDAETSQTMLCGNPDMVRDTTAALEERGFKRNRRKQPGQITIEAYW